MLRSSETVCCGDRDVAYSIFFLVCLILAPLVTHLRQCPPAALFAVAALVYFAFGGVGLINAQIILSNIQKPESQYQYTHNVLYRGHGSINLGLTMAFFAALTWLQTCFGRMLYPKITKAFFWLFHLGLIGSSAYARALAFFFPKPRRYIDYPEIMETFILVSSWASFVTTIAVLSLLGLLVWSSMLAWWVTRNS
jgi:hypothetical protein